MNELLQHPAVQAGIAPLAVALVVAAALWRTRLAWLGVVAAYATAVALSTGFAVQPLTAGRKVMLLIGLAPLVGVLLDQLARPPRWTVPLLALLCGAATWWVFASVLGQREWPERAALALGLFFFVALHAALLMRLRADGGTVGAVGVAGGLGVGVAALLSASIGYFAGGVAVAAGAGALLLLQFTSGHDRAPGFTGTLPLGLGLALFAAASTLLAQMPWFVAPLLLVIPLTLQRMPWPEASRRVRMLAAGGIALCAALLFVAAVWFAVRAASPSPV